MNCPRCGETRYRYQWKPSQWAAVTAFVNDFNCCKVCSIDCYLPANQAERSSDLNASEQALDLNARVELWVLFKFCTQNGWVPVLRRFFENWVAEERTWRKELSYYGALKRSRQSDPCGWAGRDSDLEKVKHLSMTGYFDPGNFHYRKCFETLFGKVDWKAETVGDIIEGLLGMHYLVQNNCTKSKDLPVGFVKFLHNWCLAVYRYNQSLGWAVPYDEVFARIKNASRGVTLCTVS